ncbi:ubiquinol-cytochrome c reductase iron-sulfur subunit [Paenisporosarcina antarctica]|uniref:Menaquinol:cytochrome c reductase iron-sulfur subunit n=1 Tax=Paenisporosarcina antarctica TaxID=417367 RepID=A0A4P7A0F5_9BACL|nr:ubiquinol-cytochrome c reductase iron-sulfur subunit [Paenisporosarcina antarctica]QBP41326.1 ubiquinol-cytochrome c reductase iron-sulfur subunit [Paenisporosarcina antarctica]
MSNNRVSRRQFLNYTLTGVGGFMAAGMLMPMVRFAIDPVLQKAEGGDFIPTDKKVAELTEVPVRVDFSFEQVDGWYTSDVTSFVWVYKEGDKLIALSPVCKHLGCTVSWAGTPDHKDQFFCPCHAGRYKKNGENIKGTPPLGPLDEFETREKDGLLQIGKTRPNTLV